MQGELESATELAKKATVMKSQFLANMSHEVERGGDCEGLESRESE